MSQSNIRACESPDCFRDHYARGLCKSHYNISVRLDSRLPCDIEDCARPHYARGWCRMHYRRWKKTGNPVEVRALKQTHIADRLEAYSMPSGECRVWTRSTDRSGYGRVYVDSERPRSQAHRAMWELHNEPIPAGLVIRHTCDNPPCIRLDHLEIGTVADNNRDKIERGRDVRGDAHPNTNLTSDQVTDMRRLWALGTPQTVLAREFNTSKSSVHRIVHRMVWTHLPEVTV